jgi:pimeloyl-ACP methyl ester carboxylesterase
MHEPALTRSSSGDQPRGLVLMLHGGAEQNTDPVGDRNRAWLRSWLMMRELRTKFHRAGVDVWLLRYRFVGWNHGHDQLPSPVPDARWALDEVRRAHGDLPVVLLGHSMGGRTAVAVAADPNVRGVVALAPWFPEDEPVEPLTGKHLAAAHGRLDRITFGGATKRFVDRASAVAESTEMFDMGQAGHYMLRRRRVWNRFAVDHALELLA